MTGELTSLVPFPERTIHNFCGIGPASLLSITWISSGCDESAELVDLLEQHVLCPHLAEEKGKHPWFCVFRESLVAGVSRRPGAYLLMGSLKPGWLGPTLPELDRWDLFLPSVVGAPAGLSEMQHVSPAPAVWTRICHVTGPSSDCQAASEDSSKVSRSVT